VGAYRYLISHKEDQINKRSDRAMGTKHFEEKEDATD
jgi:hypothetical protein